MLDHLWEEDPVVQQMKAKVIAEGFAEGFMERFAKSFGESFADKIVELCVIRARRYVLRIVELRFLGIWGIAQRTVYRINDLTTLDLLLEEVVVAPDEATALAAINKRTSA